MPHSMEEVHCLEVNEELHPLKFLPQSFSRFIVLPSSILPFSNLYPFYLTIKMKSIHESVSLLF